MNDGDVKVNTDLLEKVNNLSKYQTDVHGIIGLLPNNTRFESVTANKKVKFREDPYSYMQEMPIPP
jgi:hypothetical protein